MWAFRAMPKGCRPRVGFFPMGSRVKRVLVVEDDADEREVLQQFLARWGFEAEGVSDAKQADEMLVWYEPDFIVADLGLPYEGVEVIRRLRSARGRQVCIIAFSGWHRLHEAALAAGADAFVLKPDLKALERLLLAPPLSQLEASATRKPR